MPSPAFNRLAYSIFLTAPVAAIFCSSARRSKSKPPGFNKPRGGRNWTWNFHTLPATRPGASATSGILTPATSLAGVEPLARPCASPYQLSRTFLPISFSFLLSRMRNSNRVLCSSFRGKPMICPLTSATIFS